MNVYDKAHELARELKNSPEYQEYQRCKEVAMENETQKALIQEYKKLQFQLQVSVAGGGKPDPAEMERLQKIMAVLQLSQDATRYLMAEFRFQRMLTDIFKILADVAGVDLDMLAQG